MASLLELKARLWRRERRRAIAAEAALRVAGRAAALAAALVLADHAFGLPQSARGLLLGLALGAALAELWHALIAPWRACGWSELLDGAAAAEPRLRHYLKPAWELSRAPEDPSTSASLRREHLERTDALLRSLPDAPVFRAAPSLAALRAAALGAALLATAAAFGARPSWTRALLPWRDLPLERFVQIEPGDAVVDWGGEASISARWLPGSPIRRDEDALLLWVRGEGGWKRARWDRLDARSAAFRASGISAPLRYRLSWRDLASRVYELSPALAPRLESLRAKAHGRDSSVRPLSPAEPLPVVRGSWLSVIGRPNQALSRAELRLSGLPPVTMKAQPNGELEAGFLVQEDLSVRVALEASDGRVDPDPPSFSIRAINDEAPAVELLSPLAPVQAGPSDAVPIAYAAKDDGGLSRISLIVRAPGRPERELALESPGGRRETAGDHSFELSELPLGRVEFQVKAVDNGSPPRAGLSAKAVVEIVDLEAGHAEMERGWLKAEETLAALAARERKAESLSRAESAAEHAGEAAALSQEWREAADGLERLSRAMASDAYANPGVAEQSQAIARELREAETRDLPAALEAARAGRWEEAGRKHGRLAQRAEGARKALAEGRKLQGMQDFYTKAGRMSQSGASLEAQLDELARGAAPSPAEAARLKGALEKLRREMEAFQKTLESLPSAETDGSTQRQVELPVEAARRSADALAAALSRGDYAEAARQAERLARELAQLQKALGGAGSALARAANRGAASKAQALWNAVIEEQSKVLESTRKLEEGRLDRKVSAQRERLAELAREQKALSSSATARVDFPQDALVSMRRIQNELETRKVVDSPGLLEAVSARLRAEPPRPDGARALEPFAAAEDGIRRRLEEAAALSPEPLTSAQTEGARRAQDEVESRTGELQGALGQAQAEGALLPESALEKVSAARREQASAASSLGRGDAGGAMKSQERALELLSDGQQEAGKSSEAQQSAEGAMGEPFGRRVSGVRVMRGGAGQGAQLGFVPLPEADQYRPPRALREELEKSLKERRPASYDPIIKEYFKRIAQ